MKFLELSDKPNPNQPFKSCSNLRCLLLPNHLVASKSSKFAKPLLLASLHGCESTVTAGGLGVLTTHTNAPVVTETPVKAHPLHALNVLRQSAIVIDKTNSLFNQSLAKPHKKYLCMYIYIYTHTTQG